MNPFRVTSIVRRPLAAALAGIACALLLGIAPAAVAQEAASTGWAQAQGGPAHQGSDPAAPAPPYAQAWATSVPLAGPGARYGMSAPVLSGTTAIAVGPEQVLGFDLATGEQAFAVPRDFGPSVTAAVLPVGDATAVLFTEGFANEGPGATPTPTPSASSPSSDTPVTPSPGASASASAAPPARPVDSHLGAFDLKTRKPLWDRIQLDDASKTGVTVEGTTAFVGTSAGSVYAVDAATGKIRWKVSVSREITAPIAVDGGLAIVTVQGEVGTAPDVVALKVADGSQAWRFSGETPGLVSGPAVGDGVVYVGLTDNTVRALDLVSGQQRWSARLNAPVSPLGGAVPADGALFVLDVNGQIYRLDVADGSRVWDYALNEGTSRGWPVLAGESVLVATTTGRLVAISADAGHLVWQSGTGEPLRGLMPTTDLIVAIRGGTAAGITAFGHDGAGILVDVVSPTVVDLAMMARGFLVAAVLLVVVIVLLGGVLRRRMGPAFIIEGDDVPPVPTEAAP